MLKDKRTEFDFSQTGENLEQLSWGQRNWDQNLAPAQQTEPNSLPLSFPTCLHTKKHVFRFLFFFIYSCVHISASLKVHSVIVTKMPTDVKKFHRFNNILLGNMCRNACIFSVPWLWAVGHLSEKEEGTFLPRRKLQQRPQQWRLFLATWTYALVSGWRQFSQDGQMESIQKDEKVLGTIY